jgi:hypothetical protein
VGVNLRTPSSHPPRIFVIQRLDAIKYSVHVVLRSLPLVRKLKSLKRAWLETVEGRTGLNLSWVLCTPKSVHNDLIFAPIYAFSTQIIS